MKKKAEIKKIVLELGNKEIELSLEQAKKLQELLNGMLGENKIQYIPTYPTYIERHRQYWDYPQPTCTLTTTSGTGTDIKYLKDSQTVSFSI